MKKDIFIFIDPGYLDNIGHYENYGNALRQEAKRRGIEFWHIVNRSVPKEKLLQNDLTPLFLRPAFLGSILQQPDELQFVLTAFTAKLHLTCHWIIKRGFQDHKIVFFMYTGHPNYLNPIAEVLNDPVFQGLDVRFYFNIFYVDNGFARKVKCAEYMTALSSISSDLERLDPAGKVVLCTDSDRIRNTYEPYFKRPFSIIPIPLTKGRSTTEPVKKIFDQSQIVLGFLGYTHVKQGYPFIHRLYYDIINSPRFSNVHMCVRHNIFNADPENAENLRDLLSKKKRIDNEINFLSRTEYLAFMDKCDILLIPHSQEHYPVQTSGMFIDALSHGKIVVVPENTWLSDQLTSYGAGVTFSGDSYENFLKAVSDAVESYTTLQRYRFQNINKFCEFHCAQSLFDKLLSASPGSAESTNPATNKKSVDLPWQGTEQKGQMPLQEDDRIVLLSLDLLRQQRDTVELIYREKIRREKNLGWHYLLDLTWIIEQMYGVPRGATILDAGAGMGLLQFLLVTLGYQVISVDFAPRPTPPDVQTIKISHGSKFKHHYIEHLTTNFARSHQDEEEHTVLNSQDEFMELMVKEKAPLIFYQADLLNMPLLPDAAVDAVVSVSALEHIDRPLVGKAIDECLRILKPGGFIYATTSATPANSWYHEPSQGWCYDESSLREIFQLIPPLNSNFEDYDQIMKDLRRLGNELQVQLAPFYIASQHNGMPWGVWNPEYLPVAVKKRKPKNK